MFVIFLSSQVLAPVITPAKVLTVNNISIHKWVQSLSAGSQFGGGGSKAMEIDKSDNVRNGELKG